MRLTRRVTSGLLTATAAAAVVAMSAGPSIAATTLTAKVTNGGSITATASSTKLSDAGVSVTCTSSKATGSIPTGSHTGASPLKVGTAAKLSFSNCSGPLGTVTTKVEGLPYTISVDSKTTSTGKTDGIISGVKVAVSMTGCSFMVTGSSPGYYTNKTHTLTMTTTSKLPVKPLNTAQLTISGVATGTCGGLINNGDHPTYVATYKVSKAVTIKVS